jgi:hypothetical protein
MTHNETDFVEALFTVFLATERENGIAWNLTDALLRVGYALNEANPNDSISRMGNDIASAIRASGEARAAAIRDAGKEIAAAIREVKPGSEPYQPPASDWIPTADGGAVEGELSTTPTDYAALADELEAAGLLDAAPDEQEGGA